MCDTKVIECVCPIRGCMFTCSIPTHVLSREVLYGKNAFCYNVHNGYTTKAVKFDSNNTPKTVSNGAAPTPLS